MRHLPLGAAGLLAAALNLGCFAAYATDRVLPEEYRYDMNLNIKDILSTYEEPTVLCEAVDAHRSYMDSNGQPRILGYLKLSEACRRGD